MKENKEKDVKDPHGHDGSDGFSFNVVDNNVKGSYANLCAKLNNVSLECKVSPERRPGLRFLFDYAVLKNGKGHNGSYVVLRPLCVLNTLRYQDWMTYYGSKIEDALSFYSSYLGSLCSIEFNVVVKEGKKKGAS